MLLSHPEDSNFIMLIWMGVMAGLCVEIMFKGSKICCFGLGKLELYEITSQRLTTICRTFNKLGHDFLNI